MDALSQCEICFPLFSETTHTTLKLFSQHFLMQWRYRLLQKKSAGRFFGQAALALLTSELGSLAFKEI